MKNALVALVLLISLNVYAQEGLYKPQNEVRGNGKSVQALTIDENLRPFLRIDDQGGKLILSIEHPQGKPVWINSSIIKITIKTPALTGLTYRSNSQLVVNNIHGESLDLANQGNATITLLGSIKAMNLTNLANGYVDAQKLTTQKINVVSRANGSVRVHAKEVNVVNTGRGSVVNVADSSQKDNK